MNPSSPFAAIASTLPAGPRADRRRHRVLAALVGVIVAGWLIAAATVVASLAQGESWTRALRSTALLQVHRLRLPGGSDSWAPMWSGLARWRESQSADRMAEGDASPYRLALELDRCKFQYPPSSWLLMEALPAPAERALSCVADGAPGADFHAIDWPARPWLAAASSLACLGLIGVAAWLVVRPRPDDSTRSMAVGGAAIVAGLGFYPLIKGHALGQLQVFINLALGIALLSWPHGPRRCGVLVGLCCLFKPQYALFLLWGLLRRHRSFAAALAAVLAVGHGAALLRYGLDVHLQYLQWLQGLSQVGEAFWANQSANGLINRLLQTGDAVLWAPAGFPAYDPRVRWVTLATSALVLLAALWPARSETRLDFAAMLAALTIASPIAWEHHYGAFLPVFALMLGVLASQVRWPRRDGLLLGLAFVAMANAVLRPEWIFTGPVAGLAGSHLWFGAMLLLWLLLVWRVRAAGAA